HRRGGQALGREAAPDRLPPRQRPASRTGEVLREAGVSGARRATHRRVLRRRDCSQDNIERRTMYKYEFMTLTQLGQLFGVTSHQLGRWLVNIGLRNDQKRPAKKAFDGDYCKMGPSRGDGYNWIWNTEKTVEALTQAGHKMVSPPPLD